MAVVDELVTLLGLETDPSAKGEAKSFSELVGGVRKASLAAGTALIALSGAAFAMAKQFAGTADESGKFAASVGINIKKLEELEFATERAGGSSSELRGDLDGLAKTFGSADRGIDTASSTGCPTAKQNWRGSPSEYQRARFDYSARAPQALPTYAQSFARWVAGCPTTPSKKPKNLTTSGST